MFVLSFDPCWCREQFLNMPLPTGLGYKSSRLLGNMHADKVGWPPVAPRAKIST